MKKIKKAALKRDLDEVNRRLNVLHLVVDGIEEQLAEHEQVEEGQTASPTSIRTVHVYITGAQARYLAKFAIPMADQVITMVDDKGWIFVEQASTAGEEGSGVWVDTAGTEHQGPHGAAA